MSLARLAVVSSKGVGMTRIHELVVEIGALQDSETASSGCCSPTGSCLKYSTSANEDRR